MHLWLSVVAIKMPEVRLSNQIGASEAWAGAGFKPLSQFPTETEKKSTGHDHLTRKPKLSIANVM